VTLVFIARSHGEKPAQPTYGTNGEAPRALYDSMLALYDLPVLEMVSLLFFELYQLLQYSYDCSSVMSICNTLT
jgi:hypothetical protein